MIRRQKQEYKANQCYKCGRELLSSEWDHATSRIECSVCKNEYYIGLLRDRLDESGH